MEAFKPGEREASRAAFEIWAGGLGWNTRRADRGGGYDSERTDGAWMVWEDRVQPSASSVECLDWWWSRSIKEWGGENRPTWFAVFRQGWAARAEADERIRSTEAAIARPPPPAFREWAASFGYDTSTAPIEVVEALRAGHYSTFAIAEPFQPAVRQSKRHCLTCGSTDPEVTYNTRINGDFLSPCDNSFHYKPDVSPIKVTFAAKQRKACPECRALILALERAAKSLANADRPSCARLARRAVAAVKGGAK